MKDDPRIFPFGKFIRKTSIDEMPQFWNVLKGDMSLVGTRPPTVDEYDQYDVHHKKRLAIKPGLTGLWQISGRSDITDFEEVVRLDAEYIRKWSIVTDLKIMIKTVIMLLRQKGAV
ncbi:MAG: sugar transferase, partial [Lachnospiraceae bacterium]|nr:sugar transferase [Lachnospiraceae bacterium]